MMMSIVGIRGSPPQVRGKHTAGLWPKNSYRITPAGAGKTPYLSLFSFIFQDHPRRCGENGVQTLMINTDKRITPAGAGKTRNYTFNVCAATDHPRRCGENCYNGC